MTDLNGWASWPSDRPGEPEPHAGDLPTDRVADDQPGLVNESVAKTTIPVTIMMVSIVVLLAVVIGVAWLVTAATDQDRPGTPVVPEPTGVPVLPVQAGEFVRDPGTSSAPPDFGIDRTVLTSSAYYRRDGDDALIAVAARPVRDEKFMFDQMRVLAQRQVDDGWCGREESTGYDICTLRRNQTAVFVVALRDQSAPEIMAALRLILSATE